MLDTSLTRRSFIAGSAGVAAVAAGGGFASFSAWEKAHAAEGAEEEKAGYSYCNSCASRCGYTVYKRDGRVGRIIADENHPFCEGTLCGRGYAFPEMAYSEDRLTDPMKKNENGEFEAISWEQAYEEIGEKIKRIIADYGPEAFAYFEDSKPMGKFYGRRFVNALGSPNVFTHSGACNMSKVAGIIQTIGYSDFLSDVANSKMVMFIGRSYADGIQPRALHELQKAKANGCKIVSVDPRRNNTGSLFADEWLPINPGTDLALLLAMSNVLITEGRYNAEFVEQNAYGFEEWAEAIKDNTPEWAEAITGIEASTIKRLALELADAAPAASVECGWRGAMGCQYKNSGETERAIVLFNSLLANWNQPGGVLLLRSVATLPLTDPKFASLPAAKMPPAGTDLYPLAPAVMGSNAYGAQMCMEGKLKGAVSCANNMAAGYQNPSYIREALGKLELLVHIDIVWSEMCKLADYVLPDVTYLERLELPSPLTSIKGGIMIRDAVIDRVHPNTRPVSQIFTELAEASGIGEHFQFTAEEVADAQLQTIGLTLEQVRAEGLHMIPGREAPYGVPPVWNTPTKKIQFRSEAVAKAGLSPVPVWVEPEVMPDSERDDEFRLIGGKQPIHTHSTTADIKSLMAITKKYGLDSVWMNAGRAKKLGIEDGDEVIVYNDNYEGKTRVKVTERINPTALFLATHYGCQMPERHTAYGVGLRNMDFVSFNIEPGYGSSMTQEAVVRVKKAGE